MFSELSLKSRQRKLWRCRGPEASVRRGRAFDHAVEPRGAHIILQYTTFKQITDDVDDARVYGGIHFRTDQDAGGRLGRAVGTAVYKNNLRPMHDDE